MPNAALRHAPTEAHPDQATAAPERPLRLLLITDQREPSWAVDMLVQVMAPVDVVQVDSLPNALWRLGRERFDSVVLHLGPRNRQAADVCRRHIANVAAVPVLDLDDGEPPLPKSRADSVGAARDAAHEQRSSKWPPRTGRRRPAGTRRQGHAGAAGTR